MGRSVTWTEMWWALGFAVGGQLLQVNPALGGAWRTIVKVRTDDARRVVLHLEGGGTYEFAFEASRVSPFAPEYDESLALLSIVPQNVVDTAFLLLKQNQ